LHSFWYPEALQEFSNIAKAEPDCAMAYWGVAMSHWYPLWYSPSEAALKAGSEVVARAIAAAPKTEREKAYVAAIGAFYKDYDKLRSQDPRSPTRGRWSRFTPNFRMTRRRASCTRWP
jgi:hypothetical protein